jgi:hypothetical protein
MPEIELIKISKSDPELKRWMSVHYSHPKGFVGRQLIYKVQVDSMTYGAISAGSATRFLPGRADFFGGEVPLNQMVNNVFFHVEKGQGRYPCRNFTTEVVRTWRERVKVDWPAVYGDEVMGWETLVELPRTGELYVRDGWTQVGVTKGYTCKRTAGPSTDSWSGRRVWSTDVLHPKLVFVRNVD